MATIHLATEGQRLIRVECPKIASGDKNADYLRVDCCPSWDGFGKTAVFYRSESEVYYAVMDADNECVIPWEVLQTEGVLYLGIFGSKDEIRKTSEIISYKIDKGAIVDDLKPSDPTPDIYDQLLAKYGESIEKANAAAESAAKAKAASDAATTAVNNHVSNKSNPHGVTAAQVGAAPSGYGYGDPITITIANTQTGTELDFDIALEKVFSEMQNYSCRQVQFTDYSSGDGTVFTGTLYKNWTDYGWLKGTSYSGYTMQKVKKDGAWHNREWMNPPMIPGVEYRTTERYNGKPVYAYHNVYTLEEVLNTTKTFKIQTGISNMDECIRHPAKMGYYSLPFVDVNSRLSIWGVLNGEIELHNSGDGGWNAGYQLKYTLYYTKTD